MYGNNYSYNTEAYMGHGAFLVAKLDPNTDAPVGGHRNVGTLKSAVIKTEVASKEILQTQDGTNTETHSIITSKKASVEAVTIGLQPENLALVLFGDVIKDAPITSKVFDAKAHLGQISLVPGFIKTLNSVKDSSETTTYVDGENYRVSDTGIEVLSDQSGAANPMTEGQALKIDYDTPEIKRIESLIKNTVYIGVVFVGLNVAEKNKPNKITIHKLALTPTDQRQLLSPENEAELPIKGKMLASRFITANDESKLFREEHWVI